MMNEPRGLPLGDGRQGANVPGRYKPRPGDPDTEHKALRSCNSAQQQDNDLCRLPCRR